MWRMVSGSCWCKLGLNGSLHFPRVEHTNWRGPSFHAIKSACSFGCRNAFLLEKLSTRHNEFCHWHLGYVDRFADQLFEIIFEIVAQISTECHMCQNIMRSLEGPSSTWFEFRKNSRTPFLDAQCMKTYEDRIHLCHSQCLLSIGFAAKVGVELFGRGHGHRNCHKSPTIRSVRRTKYAILVSQQMRKTRALEIHGTIQSMSKSTELWRAILSWKEWREQHGTQLVLQCKPGAEGTNEYQ